MFNTWISIYKILDWVHDGPCYAATSRKQPSMCISCTQISATKLIGCQGWKESFFPSGTMGEKRADTELRNFVIKQI